jgi:copper chaperone CopZ
METVALQVAAIEGEDAERALTAAISTVPGVEWATVEAESGTVSVQYVDGETDLGELRRVVECAGYEATGWSGDPGPTRDRSA